MGDLAMRMQVALILLPLGIVFAAPDLSCRPSDTDRFAKGSHVAGKTIEQVLKEKTDEWMAIPGVVGTAIGQSRGKPCILILTSSDLSKVKSKIPSTVQGYPVVIEQTGEIRALESQ